ncbi:hypothetical protein N9V92_06160 [Luminiphilus sp.]|nr:hypothetical protein [Luminiphilus sp.]
MRLLAATLLAAFAMTGCDQLDEWKANRAVQAEARAKQAKRDAQLTYATNYRWSYVNDGTVQYRVDGNQMYLRQIRSDDHFVRAYMDEKGFHAVAYWKTPCEVGKEIPLSITDSKGEAFPLRCTKLEAFTWATVGVNWSRGSEPRYWVRDYDGFEVDVNFNNWDWSKARQYATLQKAAASE